MSPPERPAGKASPLPEALSEQDLLRIVTGNARIGLAVVGPERRYLYANTTYADILALPSAEVVGRGVQDVLGDLYETQVAPRLDRAFAGEPIAYELRTPSTEGDRSFEVKYDPRVVDGSVALVVVVITDITAQQRTGTDVRRLAAVVESSDDAVIAKDLNGIITSWNKGAERLFGYPADEVVGTPILRLIPEELHDEEQHILEKIRRNERVPHFETTRRTRSGELISVSVTVSPIRDAAGNVVGASKVARDVTDRKRAEEAMRFHRTMLLTERELTLDGILVVDGDSHVLSYNGRFAEMWSIDADLVDTRADTSLLSAVRGNLRDPEEFMARVRALHDRHDESSHDEIELLDGRTFDRYSAPMRGAEGHYYGRVWYFRDVTERKRAEQALREERDRAQRYLDTADVILLALDTHGRVTSINRKGCEIVGWSEEELLGRNWIETCLPEGGRASLVETFNKLLAGDLSRVENTVVTRSGEERLIEWHNSVLRDDLGRIVGTFSSGSDITDRHRAEDALRAAEERMRFALENAGVGIWDTDYRTGVAQMTEILEHHHGMERGTFAGSEEAFIHAVHPDDRQTMIDTLDRAAKTGNDFSVEYRALRPDGTVRWLSGAGRIHLDEDGQPVRGVGVAIDVTERRSLEQQVHQAQKMEAVGRLAGGIAHDFNNLLTSILGYCQLLLLDVNPEDPHHTDLLEIERAGRSAARLTQQLLAFSRKQIVEPTLIDLNEVIGHVGGMLQRLIGEDVQIALNLRGDLHVVKADKGQMEQVVLNLAINARDAMPKGGKLTIETENVELDDHYALTHLSATPGSYVALTVSDTGTGMTPEVQMRLFEPFFTTKDAGKGTGLGLATVHGIVLNAGGRVSVYSELGQGSSFTVYLPRADDGPRALDSVAPVAEANGAGETVLVVEDASELRDLIKRMLELQGYTVLLAAGAAEALDLFERNAGVDVVLTDVVMPACSGPELAARLMDKDQHLKVVYMSGYTEDAISHHGVLDPGVAFLHKPFTAEGLGRKLREVLDR